jgi:hypothetical protein
MYDLRSGLYNARVARLPRITGHSRPVSLLLHAAVAAVVLLAVFGGAVALTLAPAVALLVLLAHGIAPGERLIERLRRRFVGRRPRAAVSLVARRLRLVVRRAGRLIAAALAMRPPPAAAPAHR